jgi:hypothetical protein
MIRSGIPASKIEPYLRARMWLTDAARLLRSTPEAGITQDPPGPNSDRLPALPAVVFPQRHLLGRDEQPVLRAARSEVP